MRAAVLALGLSLFGCGKKEPAPVATPAPSSVTKAAASVVMADSTERITASKPVRILGAGQRHPWGVHVEGDTVWWTNKGSGKSDGALMRSVAGKAPELLREGLDAPYGVAVGKDLVVVGLSRHGSGGLELLPIVGDASTEAIVPGGEPWSIVVAGDFVYFTDLGTRTIQRGALDLAMKPSTIATTKGRPVGLAVDATHAYFTDSDPGAVAKVPLAGGPVVELYHGGDKTTGIAVDATHVYWSEWGSGRIVKAPKEGGPATVLATDQKGARAIALDDARVYFTNPPTGSIRSVAKSGGAVTIHATGQKHPYSVAVDATSIYWANVDGDTVAAVDK